MNEKTVSKKVSTIDEYLNLLPRDVKKELKRLRNIISSIIPDVRERIAYGICVFSVNKDLVGFAAYKNFCSFYTMSPQLAKTMKQDLKDYKVLGATIHFFPYNPLPASLIKKILSARLKEIS